MFNESAIGKDRKAVSTAVCRMLDNPDETGIYPTSRAFEELEGLIQTARVEALGWMHAELCTKLDRGKDPRQLDCADLLQRAQRELCAQD